MTGIGRSTLERAAARHELVLAYPTSKPVILARELQRWLDSLPTEPPTRER